MQKDYATIVTTNTEEIRNPGNAHMKNSTLLECARIATLTTTTGRKDCKKMEVNLKAN